MNKIIFVSILSFAILFSPNSAIAQQSGGDSQSIQRTIVEENEPESFEPVQSDQSSSKLIYAIIAITLVIGAGYVGKMLWVESKKDK
jgi:hypothetical protein